MKGTAHLVSFLSAQDRPVISEVIYQLLGQLRKLDIDAYEDLILHELEEWGPDGLDMAESKVNQLQLYWENIDEDVVIDPDQEWLADEVQRRRDDAFLRIMSD